MPLLNGRCTSWFDEALRNQKSLTVALYVRRMARNAHREACSNDEDWAHIEDLVERRKAQK